MPRSIWSGSVSFGLVNVPVRMFSAIDEKDLHFHLLHTKDDSRIGYEKICKAEDKPVPDDEIAKAYETSKGEYVYMDDEDFAAAEGETYKTIDIEDFVPYEEIDPIYFERTYFLGPADGGEKVYSLLVKAMESSELAAIGTFVMRDKQHLGCLRIREGVLTLERMYFHDEIRALDDVKPKRESVPKRELDMALQLIERFSGKFEPEKYEDTYRKALLSVIRKKQKGQEVHIERRPPDEEPIDLMEALRASVERHGKGRRGRAGRSSSNGDGALDELSKAELDKRAKRAGIRGRSKMSKDELIEALEAA
jgi:DNA end-binding protein Ku